MSSPCPALTAALPTRAREPFASERDDAAEFVGRRLAGRYAIGPRIGRGGLADVFVARDEHLRRDVAVKILRPGLASEEWCARTIQEALVAASIDHPNVLRVTDVGHAGATVFMVMDLLRGASLEALLRAEPDQRLPWRQVLGWLLPAMEALQIAHDRGIVHRDLKPDNLFVHHADEGTRLVILDLGIAKVPEAVRREAGLGATPTGHLLGTPAFMSPEQVGGLQVDHRSDIYALGVTLYRVLSGRLPFPLRRGESVDALLLKHVHDPPPPLAGLELPPPLVAAVMTALAKDPADRFPTMHAFAAALRACLAAPPAAPRPRARAAVRLALAATLIVAPFVWRPSDPAPASLGRFDPPEAPVVPTLRVRPSLVPPAAAPTLAEPARQRPRPALSARGRAAVVECMRRHGDLDAAEVVVLLVADADGRIADARLADLDASMVGPCIADALHGQPGGGAPGVPRPAAISLRP